MMSMTEQHSVKPRGQLKLLALLAVVIGPILVAWLMVKLQIGIPQSQTNHSSLVDPALSVSDWQVPVEPVGYGAPWRLLVTAPAGCDEACLTLVHEALGQFARQGQSHGQSVLHPISLERDYPRLQQLPLDRRAYESSLEAHAPDWRIGPQLWLVDPLGRVVLHRDPANPGKHLLDDLRRLLKLSKIG